MVIVPPDRSPSQDPEMIRAHAEHVAEDVASARGRGVPDRTLARRSPRPGYAIALIGVAAFVVGCFLPYLKVGDFVEEGDTASFFRLIFENTSSLGKFGAAAYVFSGAAIVGALAIAGTRRPRPWTCPAMLAASGVWTLTFVGTLAVQSSLFPREIGWWVMLLGLALAIAGAIVVWRAGDPAD